MVGLNGLLSLRKKGKIELDMLGWLLLGLVGLVILVIIIMIFSGGMDNAWDKIASVLKFRKA